MSNDLNSYDQPGSSQQKQQPSIRSSSASSASSNFALLDQFSTPGTSPPLSERPLSLKSASDTTTSIPLTGPCILNFVKGSKLFKLKYSHIDICKDVTGALRCIELTDSATLTGTFLHVFAYNKHPIPHLEIPATQNQSSLRVSFFDEQSVQVAQTVFNTALQYNFDNSNDCMQFQQEVLGLGVPFVAGVAEILSKGRGEEAISQNLRICKSLNGSATLLFFANAQRKDQKRYLTVSIDCIDKVEAPKKASKPVHLKFNTSSNLSATMKDLSILFIDTRVVPSFMAYLKEAGVTIATK